MGFDKPSIYYWTIPEWKYVEEFMKYNPAYENDGASPRVAQLTDNPDFYGIYWEPVTKHLTNINTNEEMFYFDCLFYY